MKKKGKAMGMIIVVALLASMAFMSAMGASEDSPEEIPEEIYASVQVVAMDQDIAYRVDSNVTSEEGTGGEGTRADYNIDGGWLRIDEGAGNVCTGNAQGTQLVGVPDEGATCKIAVDFTYIDTSAITGGYAIFRLTPPAGSPDEEEIEDRWGYNDGTTGELEKTFPVYPNNRYVFTIYCERGDDSFTDSASIYT